MDLNFEGCRTYDKNLESNFLDAIISNSKKNTSIIITGTRGIGKSILTGAISELLINEHDLDKNPLTCNSQESFSKIINNSFNKNKLVIWDEFTPTFRPSIYYFTKGKDLFDALGIDYV